MCVIREIAHSTKWANKKIPDIMKHVSPMRRGSVGRGDQNSLRVSQKEFQIMAKFKIEYKNEALFRITRYITFIAKRPLSSRKFSGSEKFFSPSKIDFFDAYTRNM